MYVGVKMRNKLLLGCLFFLFMLGLVGGLVSAGISISQPKNIYSLGDDLENTFEVDSLKEGYFDVDLVCTAAGEVGIENIYHGVLGSEAIIIGRKLTPLYIGNLKGDCYLSASYGVDAETSQAFEIRDNIDIGLELEELSYVAGDIVSISGRAIKDNGELVGQGSGGVVEIRFGNDTKVTSPVKDGQFAIELETDEAMPAGTYPLTIVVYDEDLEGNRLNSGEARADLSISQVASWIEIAVDKQTVTPGDNLIVRAFLYDKASSELEGELSLEIEDSQGNNVYGKLIESGIELTLVIPENHAPGNSIIKVKKGEISGEKVFSVSELEKINAKVENGTLTIANIGNVDYSGVVEIEIGDKTILKEISVMKDSVKEFEISAPNGEYEVKVSDGSNLVYQGRSLLTGKAIGIEEIKRNSSILIRYPFVWIFLIALLVLVALVMYKNNRKRHAYTFPVETKKGNVEVKAGEANAVSAKPEEDWDKKGSSVPVVGLVDKKHNVVRPGEIKRGEQVLVMHGKKNDAALVTLKIKNKLSVFAEEALIKIIDSVAEKGVLSQAGDYYLVVFSPLVTKTLKNEITAVNAAQKIVEQVSEHNRKFKDKIEFGIGVNSGEIINQVEDETLKFTSIGKTISDSKKIADLSGGEVLLGADTHDKTMSEVKVENITQEGSELEVFKIKRVVDTEQNKKFLDDFMKRN